jgi:arsenical pump membrane protein
MLPSLPLILLLIVLTFVIWRPRGLNVAWPAVAGATLALSFGFLPLSELRGIFAATWDASLTLVALFFLSEALESNRFFDWAALQLSIRAKGSGWKLYFYTLVLTTLTTALLANDGAVLMLTPIFAALLQRIYPGSRRDWLPYLFALGFFADAMSTLLIPSNLTNIILAEGRAFDFASSALRMLLPSLAAFAAAGLYFALRFRANLARPYTLAGLSRSEQQIRDPFVFKASFVAFALLLAGYWLGSLNGWPISSIALPIALAMLAFGHLRKLRPASEVIAAAPWSILFYALGMFVVISAAMHTPLFGALVSRLLQFAAAQPATAILGVGGLLALLAAGLNNLPAALIGVLSFQLMAATPDFAVYAAMLGVNIGPKLTPYGSLATLIWLGILAKRGIHISWAEYIKDNFWVTLLALAAALLALIGVNALGI